MFINLIKFVWILLFIYFCIGTDLVPLPLYHARVPYRTQHFVTEPTLIQAKSHSNLQIVGTGFPNHLF